MPPISSSQVRKGMVIVADGQLHAVVDHYCSDPDAAAALVQLKLKSFETGAVALRRIPASDAVEQAFLDKRPMQYIYQDGDGYVFMDTETCEEITLPREWVGDLMLYTKEGQEAEVVFFEGRPLSLELPATVELTVTETEPAEASAAARFKAAILETGLRLRVPPSVAVGQAVTVDTRTGAYLGRGSSEGSAHALPE